MTKLNEIWCEMRLQRMHVPTLDPRIVITIPCPPTTRPPHVGGRDPTPPYRGWVPPHSSYLLLTAHANDRTDPQGDLAVPPIGDRPFMIPRPV